jgi:uncharacterized protein YihD (DUF1040 family)
MPRSKERIKPLLENIEKIWATQPDLRLNQLLSVLAKLHGGWRENDLFYFEDKDLLTATEKYMKMHQIK